MLSDEGTLPTPEETFTGEFVGYYPLALETHFKLHLNHSNAAGVSYTYVHTQTDIPLRACLFGQLLNKIKVSNAYLLLFRLT
jgi:hypothetical protein